MTRLIFATGNKNKMIEIREIMDENEFEILSMKEAGVVAEPEETGETFEENALIKARAVAALAPGAYVMADDSGLEIDYLNKEPGVHSARFMGHDTSYDIKNAALLEKLKGVPKEKRTARFVCAVACVTPEGEEHVVRGTIEGYIGDKPQGENGFGYDPIFYVDEYGCSTATLTPAEKNAISYRGKALRMMRDIIRH